MSEKEEKKEQEKIEDKKENKEENKEENKTEFRYKIGTVGSYVLAIFVLIIVATACLTYYLIHSAKDDYDKQYNEIVSNLPINIVETEEVPEEKEPDTIANIIDSALANVTSGSTSTTTATTTSEITTGESDSRKIMNEKLIVLYNGLVLDVSKMDEITLQYINAHAEDKDKYVITYSNYENYSFKESKLGTLSAPLYDGLLKIENVGKVAISEDYDAIPRDIKVVNTIPAIILENNATLSEYDTVKTLIVDLDGNGVNEYILVLANKKTGFSKISLVDSKGAKVADLASIEKSKWDKATNAEYYLSINNVEVIDADNDGIMEILVEIPHSTGDPTISLLKYKNGELQGKTGIECSLLSE